MLKNPKNKEFQPIPSKTERVGKLVLDNAYKVHSALGPGLLEAVYEACLAHEIRQSGVLVETQVALPVFYKDIRVESGLRLDVLVDKSVIVEVKSVEKWNQLFEAQLLTYLKMSGVRLGFLINFNVLHLKDGIRRMVV
jgi:GxxExxY protein